MAKLTIDEAQFLVFKEYTNNGYLENWTAIPYSEKLQKKLDIAELGMVLTEIAEAIEEIRVKGKVDEDKLGKECIDMIIRTLNFMSRKGLKASKYLEEKAAINEGREWLHGKDI